MTSATAASSDAGGLAAAVARHARAERRRVLLLAGLAVMGVALLVADLLTGPSGLTAAQLWRGLVDPDSLSRPARVIVFDVRLPQAALAALVGAALALAGAEMQTVLGNPLASPYTLGISSAAALGAAVAIVLGVSLPGVPQAWLVPVNAFLFALAAAASVQALARLRGAGPETLILFGIALLFGANAGIALLQFLASAQTLQQLVFWTLGGLTRADGTRVAIVGAALAVALPSALWAAASLNGLRLGEERASSLGVDVARLRLVSLLRVSLLTATAVAAVGTVGFVGLVAPHMARLLVGEDHRLFLPGSALAGAVVLSAASVASKSLAPGIVVPVGIVTAIVGVPVFLALILSRRGRTP